jgi:hypothetical protein
MTAKQRQARAKFKAAIKEAGKLRKKNPKLTQAEAVKQAWAILYSKQRKGEKLGAVKKKSATKVKAKKGKSTEMHTDTKSHNVNIRVMSGIGAIKSSGIRTLQKKFGILAAKKLVKRKKSEAKKLQREMSKVKTQLKKLMSL